MPDSSTSIRLNPFKGMLGPEGAPVPWNPLGRILRERPVFTLDPLFHAGCYYVQDSSAMFVGALFRRLLPEVLRPGIRVLDLCAAPGGKTTDLAASLRESCGGDFLLVSNEVMRARSRILLDNVAVWGDPNVVVTSVDPAAFASLRGYFDVIVADVPCSGEGMFRKDPRAREEWSPEVVDLCAARQKRILADVWPSLKSGGVLIYSTCTYEEKENDDNLKWAAQELGGRIVEPTSEYSAHGVRTTDCGNLLHDGEVPGEGQWTGALFKEGGDRSGAGDKSLDTLHPLRRGVPEGEWKGRDFIPSPDWALSLDFERGRYPEAEVDRLTALKFLHRDSISLSSDAPRGYNVITYMGRPLGFVKNLGNRCNNLHPQARRILMDIK